MKRLVILLLCFCAQSFAISNFTYYWNVNLLGDTATVRRMKANYDTVRNWDGRLVDTLNNTVPRWSGILRNHDSIHTYMKIDTIARGVTHDSLRFGSGSWLNHYSYGSAACTLNVIAASSFQTGRSTKDTVGTVYWERIGNEVSVVFTGFDVTVTDSGSGGGCKVNNFPTAIIPNSSSHTPYSAPIGVLSLHGELWLLAFHVNGNGVASIVSFYPTTTNILFNAEASASYKYK